MPIKFDFWACQRPLTHKWGSGQVFERISRSLGLPDVAFGKTDNIPDGVLYIDKSNGYDWVKLPFKNNKFKFGYWDPPYDKLYKKEGMEIWRTCKRLAILHTHIWPIAWLKNAKREAMIAVTMGPMKQIRCLQVFKKVV
jgi:16S rRNA G966 N2-methylase RsmD